MLNRKTFYILLCILGAVMPYAMLIPWLAENGLNIPLLFQEITASRMSLYGWMDAFFGGFALIVWILIDQRKSRVRLFWLPVVGTLAIGGSLGLPLYLYLREISGKA